MTYKNIKLASLQKMFHDVTDISPTEVTKPYLDKMAFACNTAINRITAAGFGKRKYAEITLPVPENLLGSDPILYKARRIEKRTVFTAPKGKSCFFEIYGKGTVKIYIGNKLFETVENTDEKNFKKYKKSFLNNEDKPVELVFESGNTYIVKNIAVYGNFYENDSEIYEISEIKEFNMPELFEDFYKFDEEISVICMGENHAYSFTGDCFTVNGTLNGTWRVPYIAYPKIINDKTKDSDELDLPEYLCGIIPYYIAGELYLEDDSGLCVGWRNKFEAELREFKLNYGRIPKNRCEITEWGGGRFDGI